MRSTVVALIALPLVRASFTSGLWDGHAASIMAGSFSDIIEGDLSSEYNLKVSVKRPNVRCCFSRSVEF